MISTSTDLGSQPINIGNRTVKILLFGCSIFVLSTFGCGGSGSKANLLHPDVQYMADTMFSKRRRVLTKEMDTICMLRSETLVNRLVDSLVQIEEQSIKEISGYGK